MESINSFKGYGKVDPAEDLAFRRRTRKRLIVISISAVLLLALIIGAAIGIAFRHSSSSSPPSSPPSTSSLSSSIKVVCALTQYPDTCFSSLSSANLTSVSSDPEQIFKLSIRVAIAGLAQISHIPSDLASKVNDNTTREALQICTDQIQDAIDHLNDSLAVMEPKSPNDKMLTHTKIDDIRTYLSAVLTDLDTCLDGLDGATGGLREKLQAALQNSTELASNSLAIVTHIFSLLEGLSIPLHRKLLGSGEPSWVSTRRRLLQDAAVVPDITVAQDGSGDVKTIGEALARVPLKSAKAFVIRVKAGIYEEVVTVAKNMWNVVMIGDGGVTTVVTGKKSFSTGTQTFNTAPFVVLGKGFIAQRMTFQNTAGYIGQQAVAALVKADQVVFFQCTFDAYQDTLYAHSLRQFYRDCTIMGTVDFIFGDASAVFQNCKIQPRQPGPNQQNMLTAQSRTDRNENTGFSIQASTVVPLGTVTARTFLGRPWKPFSTVVYMTTNIDGVVDPRGWSPWQSGLALPDTTFYGEYMNTGSGAGTAERLQWEGYIPALTDAQAQQFSVSSLINGDQWLPNTRVAYKLSV